MWVLNDNKMTISFDYQVIKQYQPQLKILKLNSLILI